MSNYSRFNHRKFDEMREIEFTPNYLSNAQGSCLVKLGRTWVVCTASVDEKPPYFLRNTGQGWITAEYGMIPGSTDIRMQREAAKGKQSGRTQEIQRLIGRALRSAIDLSELGERQVIIDCDVIQADGGTRTAAINGGYIALHLALRSLYSKRIIKRVPVIKHIAAISCGIVNKNTFLDLDFSEDSSADVDANFVFSSDDNMIEIQCTGEKATFGESELNKMLLLAKHSCQKIIEKQKIALELK